MVPAKNDITAVDTNKFQLEVAIEDADTFNNAKWFCEIRSRNGLASPE